MPGGPHRIMEVRRTWRALEENVTQVVLFDLGGVLIELPSGVPGCSAATPQENARLWQRWLASPWVRRFESGNCTPEEFAQGVVTEWELPTTPGRYLTDFRDWLIGLYPGADDLIRSLRPELRKGCLSNSNPVHWPRKRDEMRIGELLDEYYLSFEMGVVKPDPEAFRETIRRVGVPADQIVFLDDNAVNVSAALGQGMAADHVVGVAEARTALERRGLLVPR